MTNKGAYSGSCAVGLSGLVFGPIVIDNVVSGLQQRSIFGFFTVPAKVLSLSEPICSDALPWAHMPSSTIIRVDQVSACMTESMRAMHPCVHHTKGVGNLIVASSAASAHGKLSSQQPGTSLGCRRKGCTQTSSLRPLTLGRSVVMPAM